MIQEILKQSHHDIDSLPPIPKDFIHRNIANTKLESKVLIGPRRLGKSIYLKKLYLENKDKTIYINFQSAFFSRVDFKSGGQNLDLFFDSLLKIFQSKKYNLVLFDEIQELSNWSKFLKSMIDSFSQITFIATGSDAKALKLGEAGVGRFKIFFIGFLTYYEFKKMHPNKSFADYVSNFAFPLKNGFTKDEQYQLVYEKQFYQTRFKPINMKNILETIALNPGNKINRNNLIKQIKANSDAKPDSTQIANIIDFLVDCDLVYSINDIETNLRARKETIYTLYPSNWLLFNYFVNLEYSELKYATQPRKGFVFENLIISNVMAFFNTPLLRNMVRNKLKDPDADLVIGKQVYEIKSYDVFESKIKEKDLNKALALESIIIHQGPSKVHIVNELQKVKLINVKDFLLKLQDIKNEF